MEAEGKISLSYYAGQLAAGRYYGMACATWDVGNATMERRWEFDGEFDTPEQAAANARQQLLLSMGIKG